MKLALVVFSVLFCMQIVCLAQDASPQLAGPTVVQAVNDVGSKIPAMLPVWLVTLVVAVSEIVARRFPTLNPMSWFLVVSALFKGISNLFLKVSNLLDQVIGQNVKKDEPKQ